MSQVLSNRKLYSFTGGQPVFKLMYYSGQNLGCKLWPLVENPVLPPDTTALEVYKVLGVTYYPTMEEPVSVMYYGDKGEAVMSKFFMDDYYFDLGQL